MSQQGTRAFYQITQTIKNQLLEDINEIGRAHV